MGSYGMFCRTNIIIQQEQARKADIWQIVWVGGRGIKFNDTKQFIAHGGAIAIHSFW